MTVLKTLLYFSIFKYPLTIEELFIFSDIASKKEMNTQLNFLLEKGIIFKFERFYTDSNDMSLIKRRLEGNLMAEQIMPKAKKVAKLISKFPYVESVNISGSLSKGFYDKDGDIDFFIITKPNRLWVSRTFLILYKKILLLNSRKYFCVNYFISSNQLEISEKNRFTATELLTLIPLYGKNVFNSFIKENKWHNLYFPNAKDHNLSLIKETNKVWITIAIEAVFNTKIGNFTDTFLRKMTLSKWKSKFSNTIKGNDFNIAMKSTKNVSKHHPQNFQKKVIDKLNQDYEKIEKQYNLELPQEYA